MNFGGAVRINKCGVFLLGALGFLMLLYAYSSQRSPSQSPSALQMENPYNQNTNKVSLRQLLIAAVDVAIRGGLEVVAVRKSAAALEEKSKGKTKEGAKDPVTEGDFRSHRVMFFGLRKAFPGVRVKSEEYTESPDMADVPLPALHNDEITSIFTVDKTVDAEDVSVWIDPLDATQEYTENMVNYVTTMVGVAIKGVPIMGVIHRPFQEETYWAVVGYGNSPNLNSAVKAKAKANSNSIGEGEKIVNNSPVRVIVSRSHKGKVYNMTSAALGSKEQFNIISAAGAGFKVLEVIAGRADVYLHVTNIKKWDLCAGNGILNALGGEMMTINGEKLDYSSDTHPLNTKGIIAYTTQTPAIDKLKDIDIDE